jgi:hypothetical protein
MDASGLRREIRPTRSCGPLIAVLTNTEIGYIMILSRACDMNLACWEDTVHLY